MDTPNMHGVTPIFAAVMTGNTEALAALIAVGATAVNTPNNYGVAPIQMAIFDRHAKIITALKAAGADVNVCPDNSLPPLVDAIIDMQLEAVAAFLQAGADPGIVTSIGTPLEVAQRFKDKDPKGQAILRLLETHIKHLFMPENIQSRKRDMEIKQEQQKVRKEDLEDLQTMFLEEKIRGKKIKMYDLYNKFFKEFYPHIKLVYKHEQKIHVLYINGKPSKDGDAVAEEISKMIAMFDALQPPKSSSACILAKLDKENITTVETQSELKTTKPSDAQPGIVIPAGQDKERGQSNKKELPLHVTQSQPAAAQQFNHVTVTIRPW